MKIIKYLALFILLVTVSTSCKDNDSAMPAVTPQAQGTYVDTRTDSVYHWVRYGGQDWMVENLRYKLDDVSKCTFYVPYEDMNAWDPVDKMSAEFGYLYTLQGAQEAVPEGWRIPTDSDWQQLEMALGMSAAQAASTGWRGAFTGSLMQQSEGTRLAFTLGGYYLFYGGDYDPHYLHNGTFGYYWTSSKDEQQKGNYYYCRKLAYNQSGVCRQSMEPDQYMLSVRLVRDAQ